MQRITGSIGEKLALAGAATLAVTSFLPYWASIRWEATDPFVLLGGPTRFDVWEAYPTGVLVGVALSFVILVLGITRLLPNIVYVVGGGVVTLLMLYGVWEGPRGLLDDPLLGGNVSGSFYFERGPLLYVGLAAAATIVIGGFLAHRNRDRPDIAETS